MKTKSAILLVLAGLGVGGQNDAQSQSYVIERVNSALLKCSNLFQPDGFPVIADQVIQKLDLYGICYEDFFIAYSGLSKTPVLCVERISRESLYNGRLNKKVLDFKDEPKIPRASKQFKEDYKGSGFAPTLCSPQENRETQYAAGQSVLFTNFFPSEMEFKQGLLSRIEKEIRDYANDRAKGPITIYTGVTFAEPLVKIGPGKVWVPNSVYKVVNDSNIKKRWAVWSKNDQFEKKPEILSIDDFEKRVWYRLPSQKN